MSLDPYCAALISNLAANNFPGFHNMSVPDCRQAFKAFVTSLGPGPSNLQSVTNRSVPGPAGNIPVRVYTPEGNGPFPVVMYFHGGGFVMGDLDVYDAGCREICVNVGALVVSVDYRLAPEHPFPAATDDCLAATQWVGQHIAEWGGDPRRIAVAGDSAGGNLATVTALRIRDEGGPALRAQLLIYPVTDHYSRPTPSLEQNARGYFLEKADMVWFYNHYVKTGDTQHPHLAPLQVKDLSRLPPAMVITAEFDPLRDEGEAYAAALERAKVPVVMSRYDGLIHGFFLFAAQFERGREALNASASWLREQLAP